MDRMNRNVPLALPCMRELQDVWLNDADNCMNGDLDIEQDCKRYVDKVKALSSSERKSLLERLISHIDLTTLSGDDTKKRVSDLVDKAVQPFPRNGPDYNNLRCASVCVYPARIVDVIQRLAFHQIPKEIVRVASVAGGFPSGQYRLESRVLEVQLAVADGANEIDIVINRAAALEEDWEFLHHEVSMMRMACGEKARMKTILATGELGDHKRIYVTSLFAMLAGSDFIKTSTGKENVNATLPVSYVMCKAIKKYWQTRNIKVGFKAAGGIRATDEAISYMFLIEDILGKDWMTPDLFRIGASALLDNIVKELQCAE